MSDATLIGLITGIMTPIISGLVVQGIVRQYTRRDTFRSSLFKAHGNIHSLFQALVRVIRLHEEHDKLEVEYTKLVNANRDKDLAYLNRSHFVAPIKESLDRRKAEIPHAEHVLQDSIVAVQGDTLLLRMLFGSKANRLIVVSTPLLNVALESAPSELNVQPNYQIHQNTDLKGILHKIEHEIEQLWFTLGDDV